MKRPVSISIDRLVLPARYAGQEDTFTHALTGAVQDRLDLPRGPSGRAGAKCERLAGLTAEAILQKGGRTDDG